MRNDPGSPLILRRPRLRQAGFGAVTVIVVLVMLAALAAAIVRLSIGQQQTLSAEVGMARALAAARSGLQWGLHQALKGDWSACAGTTQTLDMKADSGFLVTVNCRSELYNEGQTAPGEARRTRVFVIDAVACNGAGSSCPDTASVLRPSYVERHLQAVAQD